MSVISVIKNCRICKSDLLTDVINLGEQYITSRFPTYGDFSTPKTPITLCKCHECDLLQLRQETYSSELYEYEYGYMSGINNTMRNHLRQYNNEIQTKVSLKDGDVIVDIGSNDSTMLQNYSSCFKRIGVDPTGKQFKHLYGEVELIPTYFTEQNFKNVYGDLKCKIVSSISMFYDLPDPVQFARDIYSILEDDGIWTCEQSYLLTMLRSNSIDTICHEHLEYYALKQVKEIAYRANFKIIDVKFNDCNGGSFRVYFSKNDSVLYKENTELITKILQEEIEYGIMNCSLYEQFMDNCDTQIKKLCDFIECINKNGKTMYVYGASTKGNCLLQYANLDQTKMKYAVERNLNKVGKMTSTGIEIISEETMRLNPPDYMLVLPWHFKSEIVVRENDFLEHGGQFVFPFPEFEIVSSKPKLLITGCDGQIAHYMLNNTDYTLYGIGHSSPSYNESKITKFYFDMNDEKMLEHILSIIKPNVIVHLAGISNANYALNNPMETLKTNGLLTASLCYLIHKNNWKTKLFNASSSEIYKGHVNYTVNDNDNNFFYNQHPYSIAKIMGHSTIDFYRNTYNLPFSNGVIFTSESPNKKKTFLLNKVANHIHSWKENKQPLVVANLNSSRNIIHSSDVASAIFTIVLQDEGNTYVICNDYSVNVYDMVIQLYKKADIILERRDNVLYDVSTGDIVVVIEENKQGHDTVPNNISGISTKLKELGWKPTVSIDDILSEILLVSF